MMRPLPGNCSTVSVKRYHYSLLPVQCCCELTERTRNLVDFCPAIWHSVASEQWAGCAITIIPCAGIQPAAGTLLFAPCPTTAVGVSHTAIIALY
ncbi:uncharacterized protein LOC144746877 isoform X2 [Ciona intestinalis]